MQDRPPWFVPLDEERYPRRRRTRLAGFDYRERRAYFVTIVVSGRRPVLGAVVDARVELSRLGLVAQGAIDALPQRRAGTEVAASVMMPDHVHLVVILPSAIEGARPVRGAAAGSLSAVVGGWKAEVSRPAVEGPRPFWQARFHDRIIRDDREFADAVEYVKQNPRRWAAKRAPRV